MASKTPSIPRQELRDTEGRTFAYLVPAEEMDRLRSELEGLRAQVETLRRQKEYYVRELEQVLLKFVPPPLTESEMREALANPVTLSELIADLENK
jgi:hypothetical protein